MASATTEVGLATIEGTAAESEITEATGVETEPAGQVETVEAVIASAIEARRAQADLEE